MEIQFACSCLTDSFVHDLQSLNAHLIGSGVEAGSGPLGWPSVHEIPAKLLFASFIHQNDRPVLPFSLSINHFLAPLPKRLIVGDTPLKNNVGVLIQTSQF